MNTLYYGDNLEVLTEAAPPDELSIDFGKRVRGEKLQTFDKPLGRAYLH